MVCMLDIKNPVSIAAVSGVMACNSTLVSLNASFLPWVDFFMLALFLSISGVLLCRKGTLPYTVLGVAAMALAMGIYQAYICVSIVLMIILLIHEVQESGELKIIVRKSAYYCAALLTAALLYFLIWQVVRRMFGIWVADSYNGLNSLGDYSDVTLWSSVVLAYKRVFRYFSNPDAFVTMTFGGNSLSFVWKYILRAANLAVTAGLLFHVAAANGKKQMRLWQPVFQAILLLLLPAGMNFVCIMSKGNEHVLTIYSFVLLYVFAIDMVETGCPGKKWTVFRKLTVWLPVLCIVWTNVVMANQAYLKSELQERATASLMTRIVSDMEETEGYVPGVTPVAFCGLFEESPYLQEMEGFEDVRPFAMSRTPLTYMGTEYAFIKYELGIQVNYTKVPMTEPEVIDMPTYPNEGSIAFVGDVLVIKISESNRPELDRR